MTTAKRFYTENPLKSWQQVLGPKMHYHVGSYSSHDIFDQTIRNLYPHIPNNSSILDMGCGWGGPASLLENEKHCHVHGVTHSKQQFNHNDQITFLSDAHTFIPQQDYDIAIFIESLTHFTTPSQVLHNIRPHINKIIIKDYLWDEDWYNDTWHMHFRTFDSFKQLVSEEYNITTIEEDTQADIYNSCLFWYNNIIKLPTSQVTNQIQNLFELSVSVINAGPQHDFCKLITIVAT